MEEFVGYAERVIEYGFYGLVFLVPLVWTTSTFELFEFPKMILVYLLTILIVGAFLVKSVLVGKLELPRTPLDKPIAAFVLVNILATVFSIDRYTSIFGYYTRFNGGLLSLLAYVALYYVFVGEMAEEGKEGIEGKRGRFIKLLLLSSLLVSVYGILQHFGIDKDYWVQDVQRRVFSTLGQPNWLAAYLVMILPVSLALLVENSKLFQIVPNCSKSMSNIKCQISRCYILLPIVLYTTFWFTYSRSGLLGFGVAMVIFLIFLGKENLKKNWRPLLLVGLSWAMISALTFSSKIAFAATPSAQPQQPPSGSTVDIRLAVWKGTLNLIKDNPLLGTGPETFAYSFLPYRPVELNQTAEWEFLYNKAHNEYLNIAACTGLLGLGAYLWIVGKFVLLSVRSRWSQMSSRSTRNNFLQVGLFAGWVGVLVSNFFGFSVVVTSLLFWLFMALKNGNISSKPWRSRMAPPA